MSQCAPQAWGFDPQGLDAWIRTHVPGADGEMTFEPIGGGQSNPTFFVSYPGLRMVLRKQPPGPVLPSAHAVDREHRVMAALADSAVPVPPMLAFCDDRLVVGTPFYLMGRIEGRVFSDCALPGVTPQDRRSMYLAMADMLARLHTVDWRAVGLEDYGRPGNWFERQVRRWTGQWTQSRQQDMPEIDRLAAWLQANAPQDETTTLVHGDFRIGNLMFHPTEPRVVAVLDWELSTLGHPMSDLAFSALAWRLLPREYMGMRGLDTPESGIPALDDYLAHYAARGGCQQPLTPFHTALSLFRLAVIFEGIAARARSGNAVSHNAADVGRLSQVFARRGIEVIG